ncbi:arginine N-succinyltransferase [Sneathiella chinensis]|uniref:Arginine N-succinyltransferase n=1 Tax=Sneathiella chinensis TaxID=349750 RepID=A0ABQ5U2E7_9PROT|nr:arginine N-succinyltransferase [Sneathiella chinensis]GLQ05439.1 arginine N-succinyltransferase [Sneathiella chinensis]
MIYMRPATPADIETLMRISNAVGSGMSSMPTDRQTWQHKLSVSEQSFSKRVTAPEGEIYFLVMVDGETDQIVGTAAVYAGVGLDQPFYSYKVSTLVSHSAELGKKNTMGVLYLVNDYTGCTEIGSLYLSPDYRRDGNGRFLSRSRFLLLADFPERFGDTIIAEMRGWQNAAGKSPFWEHLGRKFFGLGFENADYMSAVKGNQFITDLMPRHPIYVDLLPEEARHAIGKPHDASRPALSLLEKEGFRNAGYIDIFDGGPTVQCQRVNIQTLRQTAHHPVGRIVPDREIGAETPYIISNGNLTSYRLVCQPLRIDGDGQAVIGEETARHLQVQPLDRISFAP